MLKTTDIKLGCVNARSMSNKATTISRTIIHEWLDVPVVTETWHERPQSTPLKRTTPPGYHSIDTTRPIQLTAAVNTVEFQNHGGLAILYREMSSSE